MGNALVCRFPLKAIEVLRATAFAKSVGLAQGHNSVCGMAQPGQEGHGGIPHSNPQQSGSQLCSPPVHPPNADTTLALSMGELRHRALHCHHPLATALESFCSPGGTAAHRGALKGIPRIH